jgi:hypothetical protein
MEEECIKEREETHKKTREETVHLKSIITGRINFTSKLTMDMCKCNKKHKMLFFKHLFCAIDYIFYHTSSIHY